MTDIWPRVTITSFEQVPVASTVTLLRVTGEAPQEIDSSEARPVLLADVDGEQTRYAAIPAPPDVGTTLRVAFSVSEELATTAASFRLECGDGTVLELPSPVVGARRTRPRVGAPPEEEERRSALAPKLAELTEELAEARHDIVDLRAKTHAQIIQLHREAAELTAELAAQRDLARYSAAPPTAQTTRDQSSDDRVVELEVWSGELERRLADTTTELAEARTRLERRESELQRLRTEQAGSEVRVADEPSASPDPKIDAEHETDAATLAEQPDRSEADELAAPADSEAERASDTDAEQATDTAATKPRT